jgi:hypothetical protein
MGLSPRRTDPRRRVLCFAFVFAHAFRPMASRLPDKGHLMRTSQDLMRCWINRQYRLQEQATFPSDCASADSVAASAHHR